MTEHRTNTVAEDIEAICETATLIEYANTDGTFSLDCYRSAVVARGGPISDAEWESACYMIQDRYEEA